MVDRVVGLQNEATKAAIEQAFKRADADMDDYLNDEEANGFFAEIWTVVNAENEDAGDEPEDLLKAKKDVLVSFSDKTDGFRWEDYERLYKTVDCLIDKGKAKAEYEAHMRKHIKQLPAAQKDLVERSLADQDPPEENDE